MILVCGEGLVDFVPVVAREETAYAPRTGGTRTTSRSGWVASAGRVGLFRRVSDDPFGRG
jgi:sugar/nucleoside kinase (ribokinase family)